MTSIIPARNAFWSCLKGSYASALKPFGYALVSLMPWLADTSYAEIFDLHVTVAGVSDLSNVKAQLFYVLERGVDSDGILRAEITDSSLQLDGERTERLQFEFVFDDLEFQSDTHRGFVYGHIFDRTNDTLVRRIPVTPFHESEISARRILVMQPLRAREAYSEAFKESYPIYKRASNLVSDDNVEFILLIFKTLVETGFVSSQEQWSRLYQFFTGNVDYFGEGGADKIERILVFLEQQYEVDRHRIGRESHFVEFYMVFLNEMLKRKIGDRPGLDGRTLEEYVLSRLHFIHANDIPLVLQESGATLAILTERNLASLCLHVSASVLKSLLAKPQFLAEVEDRSQEELHIKRILKRTVDCAQLFYILHSRDDNASKGNLEGGVAFISSDANPAASMLVDFLAMFEVLERNGMFPRGEDRSTWRQVYEYYDLIRKTDPGS